jgi:hopanoid-associated phosphorylase
MNGEPAVLVATGLSFEARLARGPGVVVCCGQGEHLTAALAAAPIGTSTAVLSFGIAAGLSPGLSAGSLIVGSEVSFAGTVYPTDAAWRRLLVDRCGTEASEGPVLSTGTPILAAADKQALFAETGALALDMESGIAAAFAAQSGRRCAVLRAVADSADRDVLPLAVEGMGEDGSVRPQPILRGLLQRPATLPALLHVTMDVVQARRRLSRVRQLLGPDFGLADLG